MLHRTAQERYEKLKNVFARLKRNFNRDGRALAVATGVKMANHELTVDLLYLAMDNQIYGLTTGQVSPTSRVGMKTKSTPFGSVEGPINPIALALAAGGTFVARGFSGDQKHLTELIKQGLQHKGFSFIDVFSPCVTYNHDNTYPWFKARVKRLEDDASYDPSDWAMALERSQVWGEEIPIGKFYQRTDLPALHELEPVLDEGGPLAHRDPRVPAEAAREFVAELM
jgi:2-oxoglutarate ferredoxin oxidoreductase subunit beta